MPAALATPEAASGVGVLPLATVVVPAHQEESTIERCLEALLGDAAPGELDVVVACNGCTDATAARARSAAARLGHDVQVLELDVASKAAALRAADRAVDGFPRLYLDADVVCTTATVRRLAAHVAEGAELAVPSRDLDLSAATLPARLYYRTWQDLPWVVAARSGRGALLLSEAGRRRAGDFPDVVADDRWVTSAVPPSAVRIASDAACTVRPPARLRDVVRVRARVYAGNTQLERQGLAPAHDRSLSGRLARLARLVGRPSRWPGLVVFVVATAAAKGMARSAAGRGWARDARRGQA
ncbi:glycosyltransferase family 2 protein [Motilibacter aurantiacus]|uniref:glycosyltransferase family 2 protein n=1 Tax=Motilibacter aurantiacus TaxID=2714955 RepID=UPI00140CAB13|nr:glycosyltransferase [Motilibacter aurantiacus]